ncbi:DUF6093 family protein [Streptomyces sp. NPDC058394]|uniref:DUF6093 family protein n=1 Tax=unclassified Streptomyces TaxID=2593676 RepID=UPI00364B745E
MDLAQARAALEAQLTDTVRISRTAGQPELDPETGEPGQTPTRVLYEPGAALSTHGQIVLAQVLGTDWLSQGSSWYRLVTPVTAPIALPGDLVEVVTEDAAGRTSTAAKTAVGSSTRAGCTSPTSGWPTAPSPAR